MFQTFWCSTTVPQNRSWKRAATVAFLSKQRNTEVQPSGWAHVTTLSTNFSPSLVQIILFHMYVPRKHYRTGKTHIGEIVGICSDGWHKFKTITTTHQKIAFHSVHRSQSHAHRNQSTRLPHGEVDGYERQSATLSNGSVGATRALPRHRASDAQQKLYHSQRQRRLEHSVSDVYAILSVDQVFRCKECIKKFKPFQKLVTARAQIQIEKKPTAKCNGYTMLYPNTMRGNFAHFYLVPTRESLTNTTSENGI